MNDSNFNPSYISDRSDIEGLIQPNVKSVLDVGCSTGKLGKSINRKYGAQIVGIELSQEMANIARTHLDNVFVGHATQVLLSSKLSEYRFDTIIFADILEHLVEPWETLNAATQYLEDDGCVIVSIPNIRFIDTIINLIIKGYWPYRERGIHDKTHLRFFTFKTISSMFHNAGLRIIKVKRNYRVIDKPHRINRVAKYIAIPIIKEFITYQYLVVGKKDN